MNRKPQTASNERKEMGEKKRGRRETPDHQTDGGETGQRANDIIICVIRPYVGTSTYLISALRRRPAPARPARRGGGQYRSIRGMTEIPRFAWFATINKGAGSVRHSGESDAGQICPASTQDK
jgi:hypothetical protein